MKIKHIREYMRLKKLQDINYSHFTITFCNNLISFLHKTHVIPSCNNLISYLHQSNSIPSSNNHISLHQSHFTSSDNNLISFLHQSHSIPSCNLNHGLSGVSLSLEDSSWCSTISQGPDSHVYLNLLVLSSDDSIGSAILHNPAQQGPHTGDEF